MTPWLLLHDYTNSNVAIFNSNGLAILTLRQTSGPRMPMSKVACTIIRQSCSTQPYAQDIFRNRRVSLSVSNAVRQNWVTTCQNCSVTTVHQLLLRVAIQRIQRPFRLRVGVCVCARLFQEVTLKLALEPVIILTWTFLFRHIYAFLLLLPLSTRLTIHLNICHSVHLCMPFQSNWCFTLRGQQQSTSTICDLCGYIFNTEYSWYILVRWFCAFFHLSKPACES